MSINIKTNDLNPLYVNEDVELNIDSDYDNVEYILINDLNNLIINKIDNDTYNIKALKEEKGSITISVKDRDDIKLLIPLEIKPEKISLDILDKITIYPYQVVNIELKCSKENIKYIIEKENDYFDLSLESNILTIKGKTKGTEKINVSIEGRDDVSKEIEVIVNEPLTFKVKNDLSTITVGEIIDLDLELNSEEEFKYELVSSDPSKCKIEGKKITLLSAGECEISVIVEGFDKAFNCVNIVIKAKEEEKRGCNSLMSLLYSSILIFGLVLIRKKH